MPPTFPMFRRLSHPRSLLTRLTALLGIGLVLLLNVLAASPSLHEALHAPAASDHGHSSCNHDHSAPSTAPDHDCVVSAFAHGHAEIGTAPLALPAVALTAFATLAPTGAVALSAPAFLLPPGCGPPAV